VGYVTKLGEIIHDDGAGMFKCGFQIFCRFIHAMHENVPARHAACHGNRDLALAGAIDEEILGLSPCRQSFA